MFTFNYSFLFFLSIYNTKFLRWLLLEKTQQKNQTKQTMATAFETALVAIGFGQKKTL